MCENMSENFKSILEKNRYLIIGIKIVLRVLNKVEW